MRYLFVLIYLSVSLFSQEVEKKQKVTIGAGVYTQTQPYKDTDALVLPTPVIFFDNSLIYIRWSRGGIYFLGDKSDDFSWGFSLTVQPRTFGYKESDSKYLKGLEEKKSTWEGGLAFSAQKGKGYIEVMALTDVLARYRSWILKTEIGYDFKLGDFSFYPSVIAVYQSKDFQTYYYGVSSDDAKTSAYDKYIPEGGLQLGVQTFIKYPFTKSVGALINLRADRLSNEVTSSPIVHEDYLFSGMASLIYTFEY